MQIGELAHRAGSQPETVRYYERLGLLPAPRRTAGNYRVYEEGHLERLCFIRNCRTLGMTLDDIRTLLALRDHPETATGEIDRLLDTQLGRLQAHLQDLHRLEDDLRELRSCCGGAPAAPRGPS